MPISLRIALPMPSDPIITSCLTDEPSVKTTVPLLVSMSSHCNKISAHHTNYREAYLMIDHKLHRYTISLFGQRTVHEHLVHIC